MDSESSSYFSTTDPASPSESIEVVHTEISRDDTFYFSLVTFKVENCLFRVPRHELEEQSHVFRDMFSIPTAKGDGVVEGMSDDNPIHLEAIDKEAFKLLLRLLYPPKAKDISSSLSVEQCTSLLKLSRMWGLENIRLIAKSRIRDVLWNTVPTADKIKLAHDYELEDWYADAYYELATRSESLSEEEAYSLGLQFSIKMARVREKVVAARSSGRFRIDDVTRAAIDEVFLTTPTPESQPSQIMREMEGEEEEEEEEREETSSEESIPQLAPAVPAVPPPEEVEEEGGLGLWGSAGRGGWGRGNPSQRRRPIGIQRGGWGQA